VAAAAKGTTEVQHIKPLFEIVDISYALDVGFRVLKLDDTNMNDVYYAAGDYTQDMLSMLESNIKPDRTDLDLLYGCLLDWGLPLSLPHTHEEIDGVTVHTYNSGDLIACFAANIPESVIKSIAGRKPLRAVFRDSGFANSPEKINVFEIFKLLAPNTSVKVI
jgi:adenine-specific DNA-methyltransferase